MRRKYECNQYFKIKVEQQCSFAFSRLFIMVLAIMCRKCLMLSRIYIGYNYTNLIKNCKCTYLAFYDERNLCKKLKNPQGVFSCGKSAKRILPFLVYSQLRQDRQLQRIFIRVDWVRVFYSFETRDSGLHSGYVTSGSAAFKIHYKQSTSGSRLGTTAHTASTSFPVQQRLRQKVYRWNRYDSIENTKLEFLLMMLH